MISSLDSLRCFLAAATSLNFRRAARSVALTPTAFGQRIKQLEDHLGEQLFVRSSRSVALTTAGLALVPAAERCLGAADECETVVRKGAPRPPMDLVIGTRQELGMSWVLPNRTAIMRAQPWLHLNVYVGSGADLLLRLRTNEIDCAVTSTPVTDPKLEAIQLHREDYVFVGATRMLEKKPLVRTTDAEKHTLIDSSAALPLFRYWRDAGRGQDRVRFGRVAFLGNIDPIRRQVLEGEGVAVLPEYFVRNDIKARRLARVFPGRPLLYDHFRLVFRASDPRRPVFDLIGAALTKSPLA
jgi:DNA-binding transcriptional LysR family regulator